MAYHLKTHTCRHAGKGEVNNSYCNNGVLVGAELVLQLVTTNKEIHLFPTCPSSLICHTHVFFSLYDLLPYSLASPADKNYACDEQSEIVEYILYSVDTVEK